MQVAKHETSTKSSFRSWLTYFIALGIFLFIFRYLLGIVIISGNSMAPTLTDGQMILANYLLFTPERGDIVIYEENGMRMIKRVIALPGETVAIINGEVTINGVPLAEDYISGISPEMQAITVPFDSYFLIGDNREPGESRDSRDPAVGPVERSKIRGEAVFSLFPLKLLK